MLRLLSVFAALVVPAVACAAPRPVIVEAGKSKALTQIINVDDKACEIKPAGKIHVQSQPAHGVIDMKLVGATGDHKKCGKISGKIIRVVYTAKPGYQGRDEAEFVLVVPAEQSKSGAIERRFYRVPVEVR
jgi:hypothetical protein